MKTALFTIFLLLTGVLVFAQDYQNYKYVHPKPQANLLRKAQMVDLNTWVAAGANGTFMKTTNAGTDWYFHHRAGRYSNAALTIGNNYSIWFVNDNKGFIGGDRGYIGMTTDGGVTIDSVGLNIIPITQRVQGIWFANPDTGFAAAGAPSGAAGTVARTTDGGTTWTSVLIDNSSSFLAVSGTSPLVAFAVAASGTIYKTTDAGLNWTPAVNVVGIFQYDIDFVDQNTGFTAGNAGTISKTTDGGTTWTPLTPPQVDWSFFQVKAISASEIYLVGDPTTLYKSTNLGASWTGMAIMPVAGPASTYIWYSMDKVGSRMILSGDFGIIARSDDNGLTWFSNHYSLSTQLIFDMEKVPGTNKLLAVGRQYSTGTRQLYQSTNGGLEWTAKDLGVTFDASSISMVNSQVGYISGTNATVMKTTDGGTTWNTVTSPTGGTFDIYSMEFVNRDTGWVFINFVTVAGGNIYKTTNGGTSWTPQTNGQSASIYCADMVNANTGYHALNSSNKPIYKTTDGGSTWNPVTTPITGSIRSIKAIDANNLYVAANSGTVRMIRSTDGGANWINITLPVAVDITSMDFADLDTGYVCGNSTTAVLRTTNKGVTWTFENVHLPTLLKVVVLPGDTAFVFGTYASILKYDPYNLIPVELNSFTASVEGSSVTLNWSVATELNNQGFEIERKELNEDRWSIIGYVEGRGSSTEPAAYSYSDINLRPGTYNYRIRQIDFNGSYTYYSLAESVVMGIPFGFELAQNYPNPFNPATTITWSSPVGSWQTLKVYDILGNEVATLVNEFREAGSYSVQFDAANLSSGVYIYSIRAGSYQANRKMSLIK